MLRALSTATTGMQAQEAKLDQVANDLANMNTTAFKRGRTEFQDLLYQNVKDPGGAEGQNQVPVGVQVGSGAKVSAQYSIHEQGPVKITSGLFDLMINGDGFFAVQQPNGQDAYTRDGSFKLDSTGRLVTSSGHLVIPEVTIPGGTAGVTITPQGNVRILNSQGQESELTQLKIVNFLNPGAMRQIGGNLMVATSASGAATIGSPGENGLGSLQQGALEASNVKPTEAIMDMITAQRAYESNARIMTVGDQMWSATNQIGNR